MELGAEGARGRFTPWRRMWGVRCGGVADTSVTQVAVPPHG